MKKSLVAILLSTGLFLANSCWAQDSGGDKEKNPFEAREVVGAVLLSGLVGGILGLSTLSFYEAPQDHIRNITLGAGAGMLISIIYLSVDAANTPVKVDEDKRDQDVSSGFIFPTVESNGAFALAGVFRF